MSVQAQSYRTMFSNYNVTASHLVYNNNSGLTATSGWFNSKSDEVTIAICCATLTSDSVSYRIEGKFSGSDRIASLDFGSFSVSNSIDKLIKINYPTSQIRLGIKSSSTVASPLASPNRIYCGLFLNEIK